MLLDYNGRPVRANAYNAATHTRRLKDFRYTSTGPRDLLKLNGETLRDRSRQMCRNNPYAASGVEGYASNAIGTGAVPAPLFPEPKMRKYLMDRFRHWTDHSDFDGVADFYGQQKLSVEAMVRDGEHLIRFHTENPRTDTVALQLESLECDHLPYHRASFEQVPDGHRVESGIELDRSGRRVAYHLLTQHPGEGGTSETVRVEASDIIHLFRPTRSKQLRGETWFTTVLVALWEMERYDDAERLRKILAASLTGFITSTSVADDSVIPVDQDSLESQIADAGIEPGTFTRLEPNESVTIAGAADVGPMYETYIKVQLRAIARGIGVTYHQLCGDPSDANFSSMRADKLEVQRRMEAFQHSIFVYQWLRRVWNKWLNVGYMQWVAGLPGGLEIPDYPKRRAEYELVDWQFPGWPWVDPLKDVTAAILEKQHGLNSRRRILAGKGNDVEEIDEENRQDMDRERRLGLEYGEDQKTNERAGQLMSEDEQSPLNRTRGDAKR